MTEVIQDDRQTAVDFVEAWKEGQSGEAMAAIVSVNRLMERDKIVAWLRSFHWTHRDKEAADRLAQAIEAGEHWK